MNVMTSLSYDRFWLEYDVEFVGLGVTNTDINLEETLPMRYAVVWWLEKLRYRLVNVFFLLSSVIFPADVCFYYQSEHNNKKKYRLTNTTEWRYKNLTFPTVSKTFFAVLRFVCVVDWYYLFSRTIAANSLDLRFVLVRDGDNCSSVTVIVVAIHLGGECLRKGRYAKSEHVWSNYNQF
jgi:hypothetical protein